MDASHRDHAFETLHAAHLGFVKYIAETLFKKRLGGASGPNERLRKMLSAIFSDSTLYVGFSTKMSVGLVRAG